MDEKHIKKYTYNYIARDDLRNNKKFSNNYDENRNFNNYNFEDHSLRNEYDKNNLNNNSFILLNEINELRKKFTMAKEKLEIAKSQKENDDKYIQSLENQLISKNNKNENKNSNYIKIQKYNNNDIYKNNKNKIINNKEKNIFNNNLNNSKYNKNDYQNIRNTRSSFSDFSIIDNNSSFRNYNVSIKANKTNKKNQIPIRKDNKKIIKRNNSTITNPPYSNNEINKKNKNIKKSNSDFFTFNQNNINDDYLLNNENKIIITNCNCIINFNRGRIENSSLVSLFQKTLSNNNDNSEKKKYQKNEKSPKNEVKKTTQERYLIIDKRQKPIYIKGKQILGMKLRPLKGDNNEIVVDNDNNIFLYDLEGGLHNQSDLKNIILDNGLLLLNENNVPILGINNIPIIDQYGDFLLSKEPLINEDNNYIKGICADVLRDKEGKPIKIFIEKKIENNFENKSINKNLKHHQNSNNQNQLINNPIIEIEMNPYTKIITSKDKNYNYYLKKYQRNIKSSYNEKNKFNFEKSLRSYYPNKNK